MKKWLNGITNVLFCLCLLVVILIVLQVFVVTSFKIPSDSMEPSLLAGDCILVDKCSGGARLFNVLDAVDATVTSLEGDEKTGAAIVAKALTAPVRQIAENAGLDGGVIIAKIRESGKKDYGFDAYKEVYCDMMKTGIVDPAKVTRSALQNAASIASTVLTTEAVVSEKKEDKPVAAPAGAGMDGMY